MNFVICFMLQVSVLFIHFGRKICGSFELVSTNLLLTSFISNFTIIALVFLLSTRTIYTPVLLYLTLLSCPSLTNHEKSKRGSAYFNYG